MKPPGTVQLLAWVGRDVRELARAQAKATGQSLSKWLSRAVRDLATSERATPERLFQTKNEVTTGAKG